MFVIGYEKIEGYPPLYVVTCPALNQKIVVNRNTLVAVVGMDSRCVIGGTNVTEEQLTLLGFILSVGIK